jgi:polyphosphate kinase 2 (PPK2 family)
MIQVFNRSHYEDILYPSVHNLVSPGIIKKRLEQINSFEDVLADDNTIIFKFYLHISRKEQLIRLKERLSMPEKKWKYNPSDLSESRLWSKYMAVYENIFTKSGPSHPWKIIPADQNWYRDYMVLAHMVPMLRDLKMKYPKVKNS